MKAARHWPYIVAGVVFAGVMGWISYTDALFVTRLAGNGGGIAYAYPTLPDGLLFFSLLALTEWARDRAADPKAKRPRWATAGLILGASMTLAANAGAGLAHSILDAVIDALVPVCFFICVEIVLWHIRRGRGSDRKTAVFMSQAGTVPADVLEAAKARMRLALHHGFRLSDNEVRDAFSLTRAQVTKARREVLAESNGHE